MLICLHEIWRQLQYTLISLLASFLTQPPCRAQHLQELQAPTGSCQSPAARVFHETPRCPGKFPWDSKPPINLEREKEIFSLLRMRYKSLCWCSKHQLLGNKTTITAAPACLQVISFVFADTFEDVFSSAKTAGWLSSLVFQATVFLSSSPGQLANCGSSKLSKP